jgi:hypothetical protein
MVGDHMGIPRTVVLFFALGEARSNQENGRGYIQAAAELCMKRNKLGVEAAVGSETVREPTDVRKES